MPTGHQDFWVVGARFYYKRDDIGANQQPWIDLGVIQSVTPQITNEVITLEDADGGLKRLVEERVTKIEEAFELSCSNLNLENLALLLLANPPAEFTQTAEEILSTIRGFPGRLLKIHDDDTAKTLLYGLAAVAGVYTGTVSTKVLTDITVSTKTLKVTGDQTAVAGLAPGKMLIVNKVGLTNVANSRTYTIVTRTLNAGNTDFVVAETPAANEAAITGQVTHENAGTIYEQDADWEVVSLDRGLLRIIDGGGISTEQDLKVLFSTGALEGNRLINPQDLAGQIQGQGILILGRGNNADQTVREARISITPNGAAFSADDFSTLTLSVKVLSDSSADIPAGRMLHFKGDVPDPS